MQLYEDYPSRYSADVSRRHRWIRGDWQIARWLLPRVPQPDGEARSANPLSRAVAWKILDNLRRSLVPLALVALLFAGWIAWRRRGSGRSSCSVSARRAGVALLIELLRKPDDVPLRQHLAGDRALGARATLAQARFTLACLPYEAFFSLDAIAAHDRAHAGHAHAAAGMDDRRARRERDERTACSLLCDDVDRAGARASPRRCRSRRSSPAALARRRAGSAAVARRAGHRVVDQPPARRAAKRA